MTTLESPNRSSNNITTKLSCLFCTLYILYYDKAVIPAYSVKLCLMWLLWPLDYSDSWRLQRVYTKRRTLCFWGWAVINSGNITASTNNTNTTGNTQEYLVSLYISKTNVFVGDIHMYLGGPAWSNWRHGLFRSWQQLLHDLFEGANILRVQSYQGNMVHFMKV